MPRVLGYGGLANTNGARNFSGKVPASVSVMDLAVGKGKILINFTFDRLHIKTSGEDDSE